MKNYDYSGLADLNWKQLFVYGAWIIMPFAVMQFGRALYDSEALAEISSYFGALFMVGSLYIVFVVAKAFFAYRSGVGRFASRNNLLPVDKAELSMLVPPSLKSDSRNKTYENGYYIGKQQNKIIFDYMFYRGNMSYEHTIGVIKLDKSYPHLYLEARRNGPSLRYSNAQRMSLEGDFDEYFNLYAPEGGNIAALSILTPDVMLTLRDLGRPYNIEISGQHCWLIANGRHYSKTKLPRLIKFMEALESELRHKDKTWRNVLDAQGRAFQLRPSTFILWLLGAYFLSLLYLII